jgi:hypothetical protein
MKEKNDDDQYNFNVNLTPLQLKLRKVMIDQLIDKHPLRDRKSDQGEVRTAVSRSTLPGKGRK